MHIGKPKKSIIAVIVCIVVIGVLLVAGQTSTERSNISKPEKILREILAPLQNGANIVYYKLQAIPNYFKGINQLQTEKELLQDQINDMQSQLVALLEVKEENARLKNIVNMIETVSDNYQPVTTTVINRSRSNWYKSIIINGGEKDGFAVGMPVISAEGLVGRIINVSNHTSEVLLVLDKEGAVGAIIQNTRTVGVVEGVDSEAGTLAMIHIPYDEKIEKYQKIITSGLGGVYPKGLLIGYISDISTESGGLMLKAEVKSFVDFNRLEEVMVLKPKTTQ